MLQYSNAQILETAEALLARDLGSLSSHWHTSLVFITNPNFNGTNSQPGNYATQLEFYLDHQPLDDAQRPDCYARRLIGIIFLRQN